MKNLVFSLFVILAAASPLTASSTDFAAEWAKHPEKRAAWDALAKEATDWGTAYGKPMEKSIIETVVVLNLLNIKTTASCGGHLDHGLAHPWVHLSQVDSAALLFPLLEEFYAQRSRPYDRILYLSKAKFLCLESLGAAWEDSYSDKVKAQKMVEYRAEMEAFTDFLIGKYLATN